MVLVALALAPCLSVFRVHASIPAASSSPRSLIDSRLPVISDFDGDYQADESELLSNGFEKTIQVHFGNLRNSQLHFTAKVTDRGRLFAVDIDHDGDVDLVWIAPAQRADVVWINDGKGNFEAAKDDSPYVAEINALQGTDDPDGELPVAAGRSSQILTVSSATDAAFVTTTSRPAVIAKWVPTITADSEPYVDSPYLTYLRERGPPTAVS